MKGMLRKLSYQIAYRLPWEPFRYMTRAEVRDEMDKRLHEVWDILRRKS